MYNCVECGESTLNGHPRCYDCWLGYQTDRNIEFDKMEFLKNLDINYRLIKEKIAKIIIEHLMILCDFDIHKFGKTNSLSMLPVTARDSMCQIPREESPKPDFTAIDHKGRTGFFEIKYHNEGPFNYVDLGDDHKFPHGYLILVSNCDIQAISIKELRSIKEITPGQSYELWDLKEFDFDDLDKDIINAFKKIVSQVFRGL